LQVRTDEEIEFEKLLEKNKIVHYIDDIKLHTKILKDNHVKEY